MVVDWSVFISGPVGSTRSTRGDRPPSVTELLPELLIGEYPRLEDIGWLKTAHAVTAVHNLQDDDDLRLFGLDLSSLMDTYARASIRMVRTPIPDGSADQFSLHLERALGSQGTGRSRRARLLALQRRTEPRADGGDCFHARLSRHVAGRGCGARQAAARLWSVHDRARRVLRTPRPQTGQVAWRFRERLIPSRPPNRGKGCSSFARGRSTLTPRWAACSACSRSNTPPSVSFARRSSRWRSPPRSTRPTARWRARSRSAGASRSSTGRRSTTSSTISPT